MHKFPTKENIDKENIFQHLEANRVLKYGKGFLFGSENIRISIHDYVML